MMLIENKSSYSDLKDSLMKIMWNMYEYHEMDVFMMMMNNTYGTTFLGTGKLKQLMSMMSSYLGNRLKDNDFFNNITAGTVCNDFRYTEFEKDIDYIVDIANDMTSSTISHVLVIVSNTEGRKFVYSTEHVKPYVDCVTSSVADHFIDAANGNNTLYESDNFVDK